MRERVKSAVLALLFVLMLVLLFVSLTLGVESDEGLLARVFGVPAAADETELQPRIAAEIRVLAICTPDGVHMPESSEEKTEMLSAVSAVYSEAVGSLGEVTAITRRQYLALIDTPAVYLGFDTELPFSLLRTWVGYDAVEYESRLRSLVVSVADGNVVIAWYDTAAEEYRMAPTAAATEQLEQLCADRGEANAVFAFQDSAFSALREDEPVLLSLITGTIYSMQPANFAQSGEVPRELLAGFDINPYLARVYEESGDMVYVEGYNVLRAGAQGELVYTSGSEDQGISLGLPDSQQENWSLLLEGARVLLSELSAQAGAGGVYSLREISTDESGETTILFDLLLDGWPILTERPAAHVTVQNGRVTYLRMEPHRFEAAGEQTILPARQAAAALQGESNLCLSVRYVQNEEGLLVPTLCSSEGQNGVE